MISLLLSLAVSPAHAAPIDVQFCAEYHLAMYTDSNPNTGDDYFTSYDFGTDPYEYYPALGAEIRVTPDSTGITVSKYADWSGNFPGCTGPFSLETNESYKVVIVSRASVNGNTITVRNITSGNLWGSIALQSWSPPAMAGGYLSKNIETGVHHAWNIAAVAGFAQSRHNGGLTGHTFNYLNTTCDNGARGCYNGVDIHYDTLQNAHLLKRLAAHEMGHRVTDLANGEFGLVNYTGADPEGCGTADFTGVVPAEGHQFNSKEFQSSAAVEGIAQFFAAITFNDADLATDECKMRAGPWDWDLDGNTNNDLSDFYCDRAPGTYVPALTDYDWMGNECGPLGGGFVNRAVEYDYLRFFWELHHGALTGLTLEEILAIWDGADPHTWAGDDFELTLTDQHPANSRHPADRLLWAAGDALIDSSFWFPLAAQHGVHR